MADVSSVHALEHLWELQCERGGQMLITGLQPQVQRVLERSGLMAAIGPDKFFWSADQAILAAGHFHPNGHKPAHPTDELDDMPLGVVPVE